MQAKPDLMSSVSNNCGLKQQRRSISLNIENLKDLPRFHQSLHHSMLLLFSFLQNPPNIHSFNFQSHTCMQALKGRGEGGGDTVMDTERRCQPRAQKCHKCDEQFCV